MKIKIGDTIKVLIGDDSGRTGKVSAVAPKTNTILVDGLNTYKKHLKPTNSQQGGVVTLSRPLAVSKVQLICPHCQKPTRVALVGSGKDKVRVCKKCQKPITNQTKAKK